MPPTIEPADVTAANQSERRGDPTANANNNTSGGIGNTDDSITAIKKSAQTAPFRSDQLTVQL
jgi:hypothetical protein